MVRPYKSSLSKSYTPEGSGDCGGGASNRVGCEEEGRSGAVGLVRECSSPGWGSTHGLGARASACEPVRAAGLRIPGAWPMVQKYC
jgi:hypothetical protein